jgi:hypothetical protein
MDEVTKFLQMHRRLGLTVLLQIFGIIIGNMYAPHPPKRYPLTEYLVSDTLFGLSLIPILSMFRRGGPLAKSVAALLCLPLAVHIFFSVQANGPALIYQLFVA